MTAYCVPKGTAGDFCSLETQSNMLKMTRTAATTESSLKHTEHIYMTTWYGSSICWPSACSKWTYYSYFWHINKLTAGKTLGFQCLLLHPCISWSLKCAGIESVTGPASGVGECGFPLPCHPASPAEGGCAAGWPWVGAVAQHQRLPLLLLLHSSACPRRRIWTVCRCWGPHSVLSEIKPTTTLSG